MDDPILESAPPEPQIEPPPPASDDAPPPASDEAPPAGTDERGSEAWMTDASPAELREYLSELEGAEPVAEAEEEEGANDEDAPAAEIAAPVAEDEFEFTPDADFDTFQAERDKYLEGVEVTPQITEIITRADAERERLATELSALQSEKTLSEALDTFVTYRYDEELGRQVPDTSGLVNLLEKDFVHELPQLIDDLNARPSQKYPGLTLLQENLREYAQLDDAGMERLDYFLHNGGKLPIPAFVPEGIHPSLAEAFWTHESRDQLVIQLEKADFTLNKDPDATPEEKQAAQNALVGLNRQLKQIQDGINFESNKATQIKQQQEAQRTEIHDAAVDSFIDTTRGIIQAVASKAIVGLETMMDATGAKLTGDAIASLIENAFSDNDGYAKYHQERLAQYGITADWAKAFEIRDRLFATEAKIVALKKANVNQRAIQNAIKEKDGHVKELLGLAHEAGGRINAKVIGGAGKKLNQQVQNAKRVPAVRAKAAAAGRTEAPTASFENMSVDQLRSQIRKIERDRYQRATQGDLSGFTG